MKGCMWKNLGFAKRFPQNRREKMKIPRKNGFFGVKFTSVRAFAIMQVKPPAKSTGGHSKDARALHCLPLRTDKKGVPPQQPAVRQCGDLP